MTRKSLSQVFGREVARDVFARLKKIGLIGAGPRAPEPGAPLTYVTTPLFLETFGLGSLRDLPYIEALEEAGLLERRPYLEEAPGAVHEFDRVLGLALDDDLDGGDEEKA